jgi:hypothetical protein
MTRPTADSPTVGPAADNSPFGNPPLAHRRTAFGQAPPPEGDAAADWQTRSPQPPWSSGDQVRPTLGPREQPKASPPKASPPKAPQPGAAPDLPPRAWASPEQSSAPTSRAGSGPAAPSWFDRLNQPVDDPAARTGTDPAKADLSKTESAKAEPLTDKSAKAEPPTTELPEAELPEAELPEAELPEAEPFKAAAATTSPAADDSSTAKPVAADASDVDTDDDDWPTRYSWLEDDETDEAAAPDEKPDVAEAGDTAEATDVTVAADAADAADADAAKTVAAKTVAPKTVSADTVPAKTVPAAAAVPEEAKAAEPAAADAGSPDVAASPDADADHHSVTADDADAATDSAAEDAEAAETAETPAVEAAHEDEDEPPAPQRSGARLVTVIPGVPRYHEPDCILIRFMDEEDIARKSIPEAKAANCTPCAACQPEG